MVGILNFKMNLLVGSYRPPKSAKHVFYIDDTPGFAGLPTHQRRHTRGTLGILWRHLLSSTSLRRDTSIGMSIHVVVHKARRNGPLSNADWSDVAA